MRSTDFGEIKMPAGKFAGKTLEEIPSPYLKWVAENWDDEEVAEAASMEYEWRSEWDKHWGE